MQQLSFFTSQEASVPPTPQIIEIPDGDIAFYRQFFGAAESERLYSELLQQITWRQDSITLFGKTMLVPRLTAWYGDPGKSYSYSGIFMEPEPWTPTLIRIKNAIETVCRVSFNSVLINLYRDGNDSVGWHSDDEPELGRNPIIGSVSFGATRKFLLKHKRNPHLRVALELSDGSLLVMGGSTQHYWLHQVPKTARKVGPRINLTFRIIRTETPKG